MNFDTYSNNPIPIGSELLYNGENVGWDKKRNTFESGLHSHSINGFTDTNHARLSNTGENQGFDNRPSFYVVAYIIYKGIDY
jgi:hypothetical protein